MGDSFERACALADVPDEGSVAVEVAGVEIAVVKSCGEVFAVQDECSHAQIALSEGEVSNCEIECWLHGSTFDLRTGEPVSLPAFYPVPIYPVKIHNGDVLVDVKNPLNAKNLT